MRVLVTGAAGFLGKNLCCALRERAGTEVIEFDVHDPPAVLETGVADAEVLYHLAGVNRPRDPGEFETGNVGFTAEVCRLAAVAARPPKIVLASSIQAALENPYGTSKRRAEEELRRYAERTGAEAVAHRLKNLFGKWCRPNYNSVTATFCHNVARDLPLQISNPSNVVDLTYVDDVVRAFLAELGRPTGGGFRVAEPLPSQAITLGELASLVQSFRSSRTTLLVPDFSRPFVRNLYATYLSYLEWPAFAYGLEVKSDPRGSLAEFVKAPQFGQIFVSRTRPGVTRGNHYHHTKTEKFLVVEGHGVVRLRPIHGRGVIEHHVWGHEYRVVDIPPGYTHSIENLGEGDMVTLFWSSEVFDPGRPDTLRCDVLPAPSDEGRQP